MSKLSTRLEMVSSLVPKGVYSADIGADHGYLIIELLNRKLINKGYACENKLGPFNRLKNNVEKMNLSMLIECELSDGIRTLPRDINAVIIAGMGGDTVCSILKDSLKKLENIDYFIISSHSKMDDVRCLLTNLNYYIVNEKACFDMNQYYEVTLFEKGNKSYSSNELKYGPILLKNKDVNLLKKLEEKIVFNQNLMKNANIPENRIKEIQIENDELINIIKIIK